MGSLGLFLVLSIAWSIMYGVFRPADRHTHHHSLFYAYIYINGIMFEKTKHFGPRGDMKLSPV